MKFIKFGHTYCALKKNLPPLGDYLSDDNFLIFYFRKRINSRFFLYFKTITSTFYISQTKILLLNFYKKTTENGSTYLKGAALALYFDALITDDEPLWEPIE